MVRSSRSRVTVPSALSAIPSGRPKDRHPYATVVTAAVPQRRIFGQDAIDTSIAVSQAEFPEAGSAQAVVLARSDFFTDALAGGPLAASKGAAAAHHAKRLLTGSSSPGRDSAGLARGARCVHPWWTVSLAPSIDNSLTVLGYRIDASPGGRPVPRLPSRSQINWQPLDRFRGNRTRFPDALPRSQPQSQLTGQSCSRMSESILRDRGVPSCAPPVTVMRLGGRWRRLVLTRARSPYRGDTMWTIRVAVAHTFFPQPSIRGYATGLNFPDALAAASSWRRAAVSGRFCSSARHSRATWPAM